MKRTSWNKFCRDWKGKKVLIMGLGLQGRGVGDARIFAEAGAEVTVTDLKSEEELQASVNKLKNYRINFVLGGHRDKDFRECDVVIRNPDVTASPFLEVARSAGIPVKMDSSLFARYVKNSGLRLLGVTGTRGKTTTTMMISKILKDNFNERVFLGGNIPGKATLEILPKLDSERLDSYLVVLELSSWELKGWRDEKISPHIAVVTNFYEDHLNRYQSMEEYFADKMAIASNQNEDDYLVVNRNNGWSEKLVNDTKAQVKFFAGEDLPRELILKVPGGHNRENAAAALRAVQLLGVEKEAALNLLRDFTGVPSRMESIATITGVEYINDTTSTTPAAGIAAIRAVSKPIVLIAGGSSKNLNLRPLAREIAGRVKKVVWLKGKGTDELIREIRKIKEIGKIGREIYDDLKEAVNKARELAEPGDVVLLSPGCASFSMFKNEFDRGDRFNEIVRELGSG